MEQTEPKNNKHGQLTAKVAREISAYWEKCGYQVLYDHDPSSDRVGKIVSSFDDLPYSRDTQLSQIDIAIVEKIHDKVLALIEIEETTDKPKTILGDIFGVLLGDHISFGKEHPLEVDKHTFFLVLVNSNSLHDRRREYIRENVKKIKSSLSTGNSVIESIIVKNFMDEAELIPHMKRVGLNGKSAVELIKEKFNETGNQVQIPLQKGSPFKAILTNEGIMVDDLGNQPLLPWIVFEKTIDLLVQKGGRASKGDAMNYKLGEEGLPLDSIEGHIAQVVYGKNPDDSIFRRISPISAILVWAELCDTVPGELILY